MKIGFNKYTSLIKRLAEIIHSARATAVRQINKTQVLAYYEIGREIVEFEQKGKARAEYGEALITRLSKDMTEKFGKGFSEINLRNMRRFYLEFPVQIQQTLSVKSLGKNKFQAMSGKSSIRQTPSVEFNPQLSWSHYCELLSVEHPLARSFYEMGKGFAFVARQKRITVGNRHHYVDLVFYNRILKCTVLIDLKIDELDHSDIGQMNFYLNYFKENEGA